MDVIPRDSHDHHRSFNKKRLIYAIIITLITLVIEVIGGIMTNSLALLSDAAHMFSHLFALAVSYAAIWISLKPPNSDMTYGYYRAEILAAFINGITLFLIVGFILHGAYERFYNPLDIKAGHMLIVAIIGLVVNIATAMLLHSGSKEDINVKGAFLHALGDMISSIGVVVAAIVIHFTNFYLLDTIVSIFIALIIVYWAFQLIRDSAHILLEGFPRELNMEAVKKTVHDIIGRPIYIHHIHVWQISTRIYAFTCHISIDDIDQHEATYLLRTIRDALDEQHNIHHTTIQFQCKSCGGMENAEDIDNQQCFDPDKDNDILS